MERSSTRHLYYLAMLHKITTVLASPNLVKREDEGSYGSIYHDQTYFAISNLIYFHVPLVCGGYDLRSSQPLHFLVEIGILY